MEWRWGALALLALLAGGRAGEWAPAPAAFELESTVQLGESAQPGRELAYKLRATLQLAPLPAAARGPALLQFRLLSPKLYLRGKHVNADFLPYASVWDSHPDSTFYAEWNNGSIEKAYFDPEDLPDVLNYKKALLSLFQFKNVDGEHNETDVSGACLVHYETLSDDEFRKVKSWCATDAGGALEEARRVARYSLSGARLAALHAEELLLLAPRALGLKARSWHRLAAAPPPTPPPPPPPAERALPPHVRALPLELAAPPPDPESEELDAMLARLGAALWGAGEQGAGEQGAGEQGAGEQGAGEQGAGERGGTAEHAHAALQLLPALRRANSSALLALLHHDRMHPHLPELCALLGLAGTRAAHAAAADFLQLRASDALLPLAQRYLDALAHAPAQHLHADVLRDVLRLADDARAPALRAAALLSAAAAAPPAAQPAVRDALLRGLARCADAPCRAERLRALHNLRRADTADVLLQHAAAGATGDADAALAAVDALGALPPAALTFARLDRLEELALDARAPLELRAAALELLVARRARLATPLARVAHALHARREHELRRVLWGRVASLAPRHESLRALRALLAPELRGWDAAAHGGSSSVLERAPGWEAGGWRAALTSVQVARGGLLRRGLVRLRAENEHDDVFDALTVEVWTRGLEAFGGGSGAADEQADAAAAEEVAGGLALTVGGVRTQPVSLFRGQAELLGHVWAGTASERTPVLRALRPLRDHGAALPLLGGAWLRARSAAAADLALDAAATASLWQRSARAELWLRAAVAARAEARVRTAWGALEARARADAAPRLHIGADLDFYGDVALCVRVRSGALPLRRRVSLRSEQGARRLRVSRRRSERVALAGRTLALGRPSDVTCRTLRAADEPDH